MTVRKIGYSLIMFIYLMTCLPPPAWAADLQLNGKAMVLIDSKSGRIVFSQNGDMPLPPASTTKILTAIIALERSKLTDKVKAGKNPSMVEPSAIGIKEGEVISMENLLYALLVKSANDAAVAIAEYISGSVPKFSALMNEKARQLGATNTHFVNPNGLNDPNHYTTAHDLAVIAKYAMENEQFRKFVSTKYKVLPRADDKAVKWLENHNKMLYRYSGANGVKTGYTREAKQCLVASAARGDQEFIAVILGAEGSNVWTDAQKLLDYGFANFSTFKLKSAGSTVSTAKVSRGAGTAVLVTQKDFYYTLPKGRTGNVTQEAEINRGIKAPVKAGQVLGRLRFFMSGKDIGSVNLVAQSDIPVKKSGVNNAPASVNPLLAGALMLGFFVAWNVGKRRRRLKNRRTLYHRNSVR